MKKIITLLCILSLFMQHSYATHIKGGEIYWECIPTGKPNAGKYIFYMKLFRDCNGSSVPTSGQTLSVFNNNFIASIPLNYMGSKDVSPTCTGYPGATLPPNCGPISSSGNYNSNGGTGPGAVEEASYQTNPTTLSGTPGVNGWVFTWNLCCRNNAIANLVNPGSLGFTLRAKMFRVNNANGTPKNMNPCFDNSPRFAAPPSSVLAKGYLNSYSPNAFDPELDSLAYEWAQPLDNDITNTFTNTTGPSACQFATGTSFNSPFPGPTPTFPNNVPATLDPITGEIIYRCDQLGDYVSVNKVTAYKCGQKAAEIYRDMQSSIINGPVNFPPIQTPPFNNNTTYDTTVTAGDLVVFNLFATDTNTNGTNHIPQIISIKASGGQFDTVTKVLVGVATPFDTASLKCNKPPCAGILPNNPLPSSQTNLAAKFVWQTSCNHLSYLTTCYSKSNLYTFQFVFEDNSCPASAKNIKTVKIRVLNRVPLDAAKLHCSQVAANGDVTLNWTIPVDTANSFDSYQIFTSTNKNGPFTRLPDTITTYLTNTHVVLGTSANTNPVYYYIETHSTCYGKYIVTSDTISTIKLTATNIGASQASLVWNNPHKPLLSTTIGNYKIYRRYNGIWSPAPIATTNDTNYIDTISVCDEIIDYKIELQDSVCVTVSSISSDHFVDTVVPDVPQVTSASVNFTTDLANLNWIPSIAKDTKGYYIYQSSGGAFTLLDSVFGRTSITYTYLLSQAVLLPESYAIAAFDSCGNISPISANFTTMNLTNLNDVCSGSNNLKWTPYSDFPNLVLSYDIFVSINAAPYTFLNTVDANTLTYRDSGLVNNTLYDYYIRANETGTTYKSTSNHVTQLASVLNLPKFTYLRYASVTTNEKIDLAFLGDSIATVSKYRVMRSDSPAGPFTQIGTVDSSSISATHFYSDLVVEPGLQSYFYKIITVDSCGVDGSTSNVAKTILLHADENLDLSNLIKWTDYKGWTTGINDVQLFRYVDGNRNPQPVSLIPYSTNQYVDNVSDYASYTGEFCYSVIAREAPGNIYLFSDSAQSNVVCFSQQSSIYIPNAFAPEGANPIFKPHFVFVNTDGYLLRIYDRIGELLFETTNPEKGWDGKYGGSTVFGGVYYYVMKYKNTAGAAFEKRGPLNVVR